MPHKDPIAAKEYWRKVWLRRSTDPAYVSKAKERNRVRYRAKPELQMFHNAKKRAKDIGVEFALSVEDIKIPEFCPILGIRLVTAAGIGRGKNQDCSPSLDRIDNSRGYTTNNVHVISWRANRLKGNATAAELFALADYFARLSAPIRRTA